MVSQVCAQPGMNAALRMRLSACGFTFRPIFLELCRLGCGKVARQPCNECVKEKVEVPVYVCSQVLFIRELLLTAYTRNASRSSGYQDTT